MLNTTRPAPGRLRFVLVTPNALATQQMISSSYGDAR